MGADEERGQDRIDKNTKNQQDEDKMNMGCWGVGLCRIYRICNFVIWGHQEGSEEI